MKQNITISIVNTEDDLLKIVPLIEKYHTFYECEKVSFDDIFKFFQAFLDHKNGLQLVARDEHNNSVGFSTLYFFPSSLSCQHYAYLSDLFVNPDVRGLGVGRKLLNFARQESANRGFKFMEWLTHQNNVTAQKLYDSFPATKSPWFSYMLDCKI